METNENQWKQVKINEKSMKINEKQLKFNENQWKSMKINGFHWNPLIFENSIFEKYFNDLFSGPNFASTSFWHLQMRFHDQMRGSYWKNHSWRVAYRSQKRTHCNFLYGAVPEINGFQWKSMKIQWKFNENQWISLKSIDFRKFHFWKIF